MGTPLRGRSGGHAGAAPTVSFGWIARGRLIPFGQIGHGTVDVVWADYVWTVDVVWMDYAHKWLFGLCGIAWENIMEIGRGGAYVPARVALQGRIPRSIPAHNAYIFDMETPLRGRSGGHTGTAPTVSFGGLRMKRLISFGEITSGRLVSFGGLRVMVGGIWLDCV